jgi:hypothetical protein
MNLLIVVLKEKTFIFDFQSLKMLKSIPTNDNSKGLCAHSTAEKPVFSIIILPDPEQGCIKLL